MKATAGPSAAEQLLDLLFPTRCAGCGAPGGGVLCARCLGRGACLFDGPVAECERVNPLSGEEVGFESFKAAGPYQGILRDLVLRFKSSEKRLAEPLALVMLAAAGNEPRFVNPDMICFVPSSRSRVRERGYNPPELIARFVSSRLGRPLVPCLVKGKRIEDQDTLSGRDRWNNAGGAFTAEPACPHRGSALLIDDVLTTGATADACARALLESGAVSVQVLAVAGPGRAGSQANRTKSPESIHAAHPRRYSGGAPHASERLNRPSS